MNRMEITFVDVQDGESSRPDHLALVMQLKEGFNGGASGGAIHDLDTMRGRNRNSGEKTR